MSTRVIESRVFDASVEQVWRAVRDLDFSTWLPSTVIGVKVEAGSPSTVGSTRSVTYKDGTVQTLKVVELSDLERRITWDVIDSDPAISVLSAIHSLHLRKVTHDNSCFVEWRSDFSNDAKQDVIQDSQFKKREGFDELAKALNAGLGK